MRRRPDPGDPRRRRLAVAGATAAAARRQPDLARRRPDLDLAVSGGGEPDQARRSQIRWWRGRIRGGAGWIWAGVGLTTANWRPIGDGWRRPVTRAWARRREAEGGGRPPGSGAHSSRGWRRRRPAMTGGGRSGSRSREVYCSTVKIGSTVSLQLCSKIISHWTNTLLLACQTYLVQYQNVLRQLWNLQFRYSVYCMIYSQMKHKTYLGTICSWIDLPNIAASLYSTELCKRIKGFLSASPPSRPLHHVAELLIATADFERDLDSWKVRPVHGGVVSRELFHDYIMVWIEDTRLHLLDNCKAEKISCPAVSTTSPFVGQIYEQIKESINEYGVVINRWPQYLMSLESAVADVEREIMKALEKQYVETLIPLRDGIPKILEKQVQRLTRRQSIAPYVVPNQLGTFMNTVKRMLDVLHCRVEDIFKSWASYLTITNGNTVFGEQMNSITVMLRKKYKKYLQAIVEKLVSNTQANRTTRLKRILEETRETEGESEMRERMLALRAQLSDSIHNLNEVFSSRIFVAICRGFWDRLGQIVLRFLESRKENRIWYRGSDYALGILDDVFASEMQKLLGNALQDKDLDPPQSVIDARSILC